MRFGCYLLIILVINLFYNTNIQITKTNALETEEFPNSLEINYHRLIKNGWINMSINKYNQGNLILSSDHQHYDKLTISSVIEYTQLDDHLSIFNSTIHQDLSSDTMIDIKTGEFHHNVTYQHAEPPVELELLIEMLDFEFNRITGGYNFKEAWPTFSGLIGFDPNNNQWEIVTEILRGNAGNNSNNEFKITYMIGEIVSIAEPSITNIQFKDEQIITLPKGETKFLYSDDFTSNIKEKAIDLGFVVVVDQDIAMINQDLENHLVVIDDNFLDVTVETAPINWINFAIGIIIMVLLNRKWKFDYCVAPSQQ